MRRGKILRNGYRKRTIVTLFGEITLNLDMQELGEKAEREIKASKYC